MSKLQPRTRRALMNALKTPLVRAEDIPGINYDFSPIEDDSTLWALMEYWKRENITTVAVDLEFETTMHYRDLHQICTVQIYDGTKYYIVDGIKLTRNNNTTANSKGALKHFLESKDIVKLMFSCTNDGAVMRKQGITLNSAYDVQRLGNLVAMRGLSLVTFISIFLGLNIEDGKVVPEASSEQKSDDTLAAEMKKHKKKCQMFDWTSRPVPSQQVVYALSDVEYLFKLKEAILGEIKQTYKSEGVKYANELAAYDNGAYVVSKAKIDLEFVSGYGKLSAATRKIANGVYVQAVQVARDHLRRFTEFLPLKNVVKLAMKISADGVKSVSMSFMNKMFSSEETEIADALLKRLKDVYKMTEPKGVITITRNAKSVRSSSNVNSKKITITRNRTPVKTATPKIIRSVKSKITNKRLFVPKRTNKVGKKSTKLVKGLKKTANSALERKKIKFE